MSKITKEQRRRYYLHHGLKKQYHVDARKKEVHIPATQFEAQDYDKYTQKYLNELSGKFQYAVQSTIM